MLSVSCEFKVCVILFWKKENITVKLYRCATIYENRSRVNILFSPRAQPWLFCQLSISQYS